MRVGPVEAELSTPCTDGAYVIRSRNRDRILEMQLYQRIWRLGAGVQSDYFLRRYSRIQFRVLAVYRSL